MSETYSLRRRYWIAASLIHLTFWTLAIIVIIGTSWHIAERMMKESLYETGMLLMTARRDFQEPATVVDDNAPAPTNADVRISQYRIQYQILSDGRIVYRTRFAPHSPFEAFPQDRSWGMSQFHGRGGQKNRNAGDRGRGARETTYQRQFARVTIDDRAWWVFSVKSADGFEVQVGRPLSPYVQFITSTATQLIPPALVLFLIFALVQLWISRKLMQPLHQVTALVTKKSPRDLSLIEIKKLPKELSPLVNSINAMLPRLSRALSAEQRFTADAAHELRTPLSALAMKTQLIKRQYPDTAPALAALTADITRLTSLIEQLLQLARLDPLDSETNPISFQEVALADYCAEKMKPHLDAATQKNIALTLSVPESLTVSVNPDLLGIALRNLIDNALAYTDEGGKVDIRVKEEEGAIKMVVADNGAGVPAESFAQLGERFYRVLGTGKTGSGLGLSIAKRIVELHHGALTFGEGLEGRGFSATITLGGKK